MKRFWLFSIVLSSGIAGAHNAAAQYPGYNYNTGPSSYAVQSPGTYQPPHSQFYQLAAVQDQTGTGNASTAPLPVVQPPQPAVPPTAPVPMNPPPAGGYSGSGYPTPSVPNHGYSGQGYSGQAYSGHASQGDYHQHQSVIPGCATCGPNPVSQPQYFGGPGGPYAYSAPSIGWGDQCGCQPETHGAGRHRGHFFALPEAAKPWFFGGGVLIFRRVDDYNRLLSVDDADMPILYTEDAALGTMAGFEVMGGRYFNCGKNAIMASYWGLFPENEMVSVFDGGAGVRSVLWRPWAGPDPWTGEYQLNMTGTPMGDSTTDQDVYDLYDMASAHRLRRSSEFHNVEINLLGFAVGGAARNFNRATKGSMFHGGRGHHGHWGGNQGACYDNANCGTGDCGSSDCETCYSSPTKYATGPCCYQAPPCGSRLNFSWLAGVRYLQFNDNFSYAALGVPSLGAQTLSYDVYTQNQLVGFQIGGRSDLCVGRKLNLYSLARVGIYNNNASLTSRLGTETSYAYVSDMPGTEFNIARSTNQLAFLSELGAGAGVRLSPKWTATTGYRAVIVNGVATSVGNIRYQGQTLAQTGINATDCLILHGLDIGAIYNY